MGEYPNNENSDTIREQRAPIVETKINRSKDGKWIIHKTIITDIKPVGYYRQVLKSGEQQDAVR